MRVSGHWLMILQFINIPFYTMELNHYVSKELKIVVGELGPVEVELIFSSLLIISGAVLGIDVYDKNLALSLGLGEDSYLSNFQIKHAAITLMLLLSVIFIIDNLYTSLKTQPLKTF